jgi:hypothetical protein
MQCNNDNYTVEIQLEKHSFIVKSFMNGPNKNEEILYLYS